MTALEKLAAAQWKINTVAAQMIGAGFMAFAAASDEKTRETIFEARIQKYTELFNAANSAYPAAVKTVVKVCEELGEQNDIPYPWDAVWDASDEDVLAVLDDCFAEAHAARKEDSDD